MGGESLSFAANHQKASKNGHAKKIKRRFSSAIRETNGIGPTVKKRKLSKLACAPEESWSSRCEYLDDYVRVIAKPDEAPPPPRIFQSSNKLKYHKPPNCFLLKFLSAKTFDPDVNARFRQEIINLCNDADDELEEKKKKSKEKLTNEEDQEGVESEEAADGGREDKKKKKMERLRNKEEQEEAERQETGAPERTKGPSEEEMEVLNQIDMYRVVKRNALIFHMSHPSKFSFHGELKATIITGEVEILGYTLSQHSCRQSVDVYSPNFCTPLIVETKPNTKEQQSLQDVRDRLKPLLSEDDLNTLLNKLNPNDSLLLVEQIISHLGIVLNKYFDKTLFPKDLEDVSSMTETMKTLQSIFTFRLSKEGKHFRKSPQWDKIPLGHCTVLCGGKGVGKSMLLKYYINKLLTVGERVLVLDFDPGQPEFTFPGCVSAVVVEEPVIGPNFTHVTDPVILTCFGDVDVAKNPSKYLECVRYVIERCRENEELLKMKWLVNTMGFCKGLGIDLMITILKLVGPNTVVQIKGSDFKNNYPFYLTPVTVNSKTGFLSMPLGDVHLSYDLRVVASSAERERKQLQGGLKRKQLRDIQSVSYFSRIVSPPFYNFNAVQPYLISFSKIYLGVDFLVAPGDIVKAFNGNTVFLSHFEPDGEEILSAASSENDYFQIVLKPRVASSLGVGFVRGVDCAEKKFYLLTHLSGEVLERVNCLSLGRVSPPHCMFVRQEAVESQTVYTTTCTVDIIKSVKRMFRVPGALLDKEKVAGKS